MHAFKTARVTDTASAIFNDTSLAGLQISSASPMVTATANGMLSIDFRKGNLANREFVYDATLYDWFKMKDTFRVTNNSGNTQCLSVYKASGTATNLAAIYGRVGNANFGLDGTALWDPVGGVVGKVQLTPGQFLAVDFHWQAKTQAAATSPFTVTVDARVQGTCP